MRCNQHFLIRLSGNVTLLVLKNDSEQGYDWAELKKYQRADTFTLGENLAWHQNAKPIHIKLGVSSNKLLTPNYFIDDDSDGDVKYFVRYVRGTKVADWEEIVVGTLGSLPAPRKVKFKGSK
jgi:hypothetical protein